jgi:hypothetical protein
MSQGQRRGGAGVPGRSGGNPSLASRTRAQHGAERNDAPQSRDLRYASVATHSAHSRAGGNPAPRPDANANARGCHCAGSPPARGRAKQGAPSRNPIQISNSHAQVSPRRERARPVRCMAQAGNIRFAQVRGGRCADRRRAVPYAAPRADKFTQSAQTAGTRPPLGAPSSGVFVRGTSLTARSPGRVCAPAPTGTGRSASSSRTGHSARRAGSRGPPGVRVRDRQRTLLRHPERLARAPSVRRMIGI